MFGVSNVVSTKGLDKREGCFFLASYLFLPEKTEINQFWLYSTLETEKKNPQQVNLKWTFVFLPLSGVCSTITSISEKWMNVLVAAGYTVPKRKQEEWKEQWRMETERTEKDERQEDERRGKKIREVDEGKAARNERWIESNLCLQTSNPSPWKKSSLDASSHPH